MVCWSKPFAPSKLKFPDVEDAGEGPIGGDCCSPKKEKHFDIDRVTSVAPDAYYDDSSSYDSDSDPYQRLLATSSLFTASDNRRSSIWVPIATVESNFTERVEVELPPIGDYGEDQDELPRQTLDSVLNSTSSSFSVDQFIEEIEANSMDACGVATDVEKSIEVKDRRDASRVLTSIGGKDTPATKAAKARRLALITGSAHFMKSWGQVEQRAKIEDQKVASSAVVDGNSNKEQQKHDPEAVICMEWSHPGRNPADQGHLDKHSEEDNKDVQSDLICRVKNIIKGMGKVEMYKKVKRIKDSSSSESNGENSASNNKENETKALSATKRVKTNNFVGILTCANKFNGKENVKQRAKVKDKVAHNAAVDGKRYAICQDKNDEKVKRTFHQEADAAMAAAAASTVSNKVISGSSYTAPKNVKFGSSQYIHNRPTLNLSDEEVQEAEVKAEVAMVASLVAGNNDVISRSSDATIYIEKSGNSHRTRKSKSTFHKEAEAAVAAAAAAKVAKDSRTVLIVVPDSPETCNDGEGTNSDMVNGISVEQNGAKLNDLNSNSRSMEEDGANLDALVTDSINEDDGFIGTATLPACANAAGRVTNEQAMASEAEVDEEIHLDACPSTESIVRAPSPAAAAANAAPPRRPLKIDHVQLLMPYLVNYGRPTYGGAAGQNIPQYYFSSPPQAGTFYSTHSHATMHFYQ